MEKERLELIRRVIADGFHMAKRDDAFVYCEELVAHVAALERELESVSAERDTYRQGGLTVIAERDRLQAELDEWKKWADEVMKIAGHHIGRRLQDGHAALRKVR